MGSLIGASLSHGEFFIKIINRKALCKVKKIGQWHGVIIGWQLSAQRATHSRVSGMETWPHHVLAVQPWVSYPTALSPSFHIFKKETLLLPQRIRLARCGFCSALGPDTESHPHASSWAYTAFILTSTLTLGVRVLLCTGNSHVIIHQMNVWTLVA